MEKQDFSLLGIMMREVVRVLKKRFDEINDDNIKISIEQYWLLRAIYLEEEDVIQKDMAEMMGKDKSSILRLIDSLEDNNLIRRVVDTKDRRKNYLMVTKIGYRVIKKHTLIENELKLEILQGINESDIDTFFKVINHITINLKE